MLCCAMISSRRICLILFFSTRVEAWCSEQHSQQSWSSQEQQKLPRLGAAVTCFLQSQEASQGQETNKAEPVPHSPRQDFSVDISHFVQSWQTWPSAQTLQPEQLKQLGQLEEHFILFVPFVCILLK